MMEAQYQIIYKTPSSTELAILKEEMTYEQAKKLGQEYCKKNGWEFVKVVEATR